MLRIFVTLAFQANNGDKVYCFMRMTEEFAGKFNKVAADLKKPLDDLRFYLDGTRILGNQTLQDFDCDKEIINVDVMFKMTGGGGSLVDSRKVWTSISN